MSKEDIQNKTDEWMGAAKETVGEVTDNDDLQAEGAAQESKAKAKQTFEDVKDNVKGAAETAKDKVHDALDD